MLTYILVLVLNGTPAASQPLPSLEACQKAGTSWVAESAKLRGASKGEFVCVAVQAS
jgi:hypothetical protein